MAGSSSDWNEAVAYWSRVGELGMEAGLREAGCSERRIIETLRLVKGGSFEMAKLKSLTEPELARATVLATLARDISDTYEVHSRVYGPKRDASKDGCYWPMSVNEAVALCVNLSSNNNITSVDLCFELFGTVEGCTLIGNALATNSSLRKLFLIEVGMGSDAVRCLLHGLQSNKTLENLVIGRNPLLDEGISYVAEFMINNTTIKYLDLRSTECSLEGAKCMSVALGNNNTLQELIIGVEGIGREGMKRLLQPLSMEVQEDTMKSNDPKNTSLKHLHLVEVDRDCVDSLTHMIRTNKSLNTLGLLSFRFRGKTCLAPLLPIDWTKKIFPALKENETLKHLSPTSGVGLFGEDVYESLMDLLRNSNTGIQELFVYGTAFESRQGQITEELRINKEYRSRLKGQPQMTTTSGRIVLCGYEFAGKTAISKTMKRIEECTSDAHPVEMVSKKLMQLYPTRDADKGLTAQSRGFEVVVLKKQPNVKSIWDFAGHREYYAFHDYVFPHVKNSYFLYVCSCRLPPDESDLKGKIKDESHIKGECEFWLRFLASNSKRGGGSHGQQLPRVRFVLTKTDTLDSPRQTISIVEHVVHELKGVFKDVLNLCEVVEVVNAHSSRDVQRLLTASSENLEEILAHYHKEYIVCEQVRNLLEGWSRRNPELKPVLTLEEFNKLCNEELNFIQLSNIGWRIVLAYLNDLGEIIFSKDIDFIVTNPGWFGSDVLGSLIDAFKGTDHCQTGLYHCQGFVKREDIREHLDHSLQSIDLNQSISGEKLIDLMDYMEMCFPNHHRDAEATDSLLFMPALFNDENETAAKGRRQLEWKVERTGHFVYLGRRLECQNRSTTFFTPGFFPRLQVHLRNFIYKKKWIKNPGFEVGKNLICFAESGIEVCVEYAGDQDNFIDILVKSSQPYRKAAEFIERHVVERIIRFCASPQGCQGVDLVESVIRAVCVQDLYLCIERKAHSVLVSELVGKLSDEIGYIHTWSQGILDVSGTDFALDLLEGEGCSEWIRKLEAGLVEPYILNPKTSFSNSTDQLPRLFYPTIEEVGILQRFETHLNLTKLIPIKLHLLCDHKDGSHKVVGQPGRRVKLNAKVRSFDVPIAKLAITLLWAGIGAGASMVGASGAVPQVDNWVQSLFTVPEMPTLDGKILQQMMNPGHPSWPVSEEEILKALDRYWKVDPGMQGLKQILNLDDEIRFWNDFQLRKVVYTEADQENRIRWVCESHFRKGLQQRILCSERH